MVLRSYELASRKRLGFSLLELVLAIAIIAILASVAVPSYSQFVTKSRRADGISELSRVMSRQEKYFINALTYSTNLSALGLVTHQDKVMSEEGHYLIEATACSDSTIARCVVLTARPQGMQADDGWLSLDSTGQEDWENNPDGQIGWP